MTFSGGQKKYRVFQLIHRRLCKFNDEGKKRHKEIILFIQRKRVLLQPEIKQKNLKI
jgi:hypothetical protein